MQITQIAVRPLAHEMLEALTAIATQAPDPWSRAALQAAVENPRRLCLGAFGRNLGRPDGQRTTEIAKANLADPPSQNAETLLGFACLFIVEDAADLEMLVVDAAARRHGVARRLLAAAQEAIARRGAQRLLLEVRIGNTPAVALYQKFGFKQLAVRPGMYSHPTEDGLLMAKML